MGILGSLFGRKKKEPLSPVMRDTLFADYPLDQVPSPGTSANAFPWNLFVAARDHLAAGDRASAVAGWRHIADRADLEPRLRLQTWHFLRAQGERPPEEIAKQVWGIVVEVGMPQGFDLLAAYSDHAARYYNFAGKGVIWEHADHSLDAVIDQLLDFAGKVAIDEKPAKRGASAPPVEGDVRVSFLTPGGICYETASMQEMERNRVGKVMLHLAVNLMKALMAKTDTPRGPA